MASSSYDSQLITNLHYASREIAQLILRDTILIQQTEVQKLCALAVSSVKDARFLLAADLGQLQHDQSQREIVTINRLLHEVVEGLKILKDKVTRHTTDDA